MADTERRSPTRGGEDGKAGRPSDADIVAVLTEAVAALSEGPCTFWACPGPDEPPVGMVTCRVCWKIHELRGLIERLTPSPAIGASRG